MPNYYVVDAIPTEAIRHFDAPDAHAAVDFGKTLGPSPYLICTANHTTLWATTEHQFTLKIPLLDPNSFYLWLANYHQNPGPLRLGQAFCNAHFTGDQTDPTLYYMENPGKALTYIIDHYIKK